MRELSRNDALAALLCLGQPLDEILRWLHEFPWDSDHELVVLQTSHVRSVLNRFLDGKLTPLDVENWADALEVREDIGIEPDREQLLKRIIFELANPAIFADITPALARQLLSELADRHT